MHEVGLVAAALAQAAMAARQAGAARVERLTFGLAPGGHVTPEAVETIFAVLAAGTVAAGAQLAFERQPLPGVCLSCGTDSPCTFDEACADCGGTIVHDPGAAELVLLSIDVGGLPATEKA